MADPTESISPSEEDLMKASGRLSPIVTEAEWGRRNRYLDSLTPEDVLRLGLKLPLLNPPPDAPEFRL